MHLSAVSTCLALECLPSTANGMDLSSSQEPDLYSTVAREAFVQTALAEEVLEDQSDLEQDKVCDLGGLAEVGTVAAVVTGLVLVVAVLAPDDTHFDRLLGVVRILHLVVAEAVVAAYRLASRGLARS
jgi:hypothetical protein